MGDEKRADPMGDSESVKERPRYKLVVSDFHLGKGRVLPDGTQNILEDFMYDREFAEFLDFYASGSYLKADVELVFNGDILNLLQIDTFGVFTHLITERSVVRAVERIVEGHPEFFAGLRRFVSVPGHTVTYVVGNHDAGMLWSGPREVFSKAVGAPVRFHDECFQFDGVYVEHGQQHEEFARIDAARPFIRRGLPEPVLNLPWGSLFVAVAMPRIKQERPHVDKVRPFKSFVVWTILHDLFWGIRTAWITLRFIGETLLFRRRFHIPNGVRATLRILREITFYPNYDQIAFRILEQNPEIHTVIFGHTHILRYRQWREGKEYFNDGSWNEVTNLELAEYGTRTRLTYAFVEYPPVSAVAASADPAAGRPKTRLKEWRGLWKPEVEVEHR